jgi:hypothetical protein
MRPVQPQQQKTRLKLISSVILFNMCLAHHRRIACTAASSHTYTPHSPLPWPVRNVPAKRGA